jgi:hypothetical protein
VGRLRRKYHEAIPACCKAAVCVLQLSPAANK